MALGLTSTCGTLAAVSCVLTFISTVFHAIAFGTRRWIVSKESSPFVSIGFHEACFDDCRDPYCPASGSSQVVYTGCTWFWNWYFQEIWHWLLADWLMMCRNLAIVNVPLIAITFILSAIAVSVAFSGRYSIEEDVTKKARCLQVLLLIIAFMLLVAAILCMVIMTTFYTNGFQRNWMPMPEKNAFGYSFWLEFITGILLVISFMCTLFAFVLKTLWLYGDKDPRYSEDMMLGSRSLGTPSGPTPLGAALASLSHQTV